MMSLRQRAAGSGASGTSDVIVIDDAPDTDRIVEPLQVGLFGLMTRPTAGLTPMVIGPIGVVNDDVIVAVRAPNACQPPRRIQARKEHRHLSTVASDPGRPGCTTGARG
jgi:hypothetical protein